ncbi:MAG: thymidine phosphorylase [Firmicutes bacterium]|uniref:Pyrimidine-nucleoside phosphorylase n=1 Tax=Candidatus Onthovivens merdipullorum TaxID=2840889 RepID=A0A9D9GX95_9BACL|nr:thymidine phosphorylase [Candidatus Onthovivens merdipullorum]
MFMEDIIEHKRDGLALTEEEIHFFIQNYVNNKIPDYQASALLMAIYLKGMTSYETAILTKEMRDSGEVWDLSDIPGLKVDKHSTGGVGDKVSLVLGPMVASCGAKLAKMSGRGLGHTGGTLDKLESIPCFDIYETYEEFKEQVKNVGMAIIGQDENLDPADKKIYALRDVTATVSSIPLIASSIMSKKLASGSDCILLDVKYGSGAFMKTKEDAKKLGDLMEQIGEHLNKDVRYEITSMEEPLGYAVGNNLEIKEVIETLNNRGPKDLTLLCLNSGAIMLEQAKIFDNYQDGYNALLKNLENGKAFDKFVEFVKAQKGDISYIYDPSKFKVSKYLIPIFAAKNGIIKKIDALTIGKASMHLGGGRMVLTDTIDMSAGIVLNKKVGDSVKNNELLCTLHTDKDDVKEVIEEVKEAFIY